MDSLYIVMPAYNEEENIENVVKQWYPKLLLADKARSKMVIADNGSTDRTHEILLSMIKSGGYSNLEILENTGKQHGPKVIALYKEAINSGTDYIFQTDSDGQTSPEEFDDFWARRNEYEAIIGKRLVREDGRSRAFVENVVCLLLRFYFHVSIPDANAPFRLMKSSLIKRYISCFDDDYGLPNIMLTTYFSKYKENVVFREISFKARQLGTNSINIPKIVKIGIEACGDFHRFKKEMEKMDAKG
ncbi:Glycosyl transferase family 2 [Butyrivibrio sp. YAB3001]|nr:Glycosyl transferase family 2 [Butyrivibrio sp. YAB3001]